MLEAARKRRENECQGRIESFHAGLMDSHLYHIYQLYTNTPTLNQFIPPNSMTITRFALRQQCGQDASGEFWYCAIWWPKLLRNADF